MLRYQTAGNRAITRPMSRDSTDFPQKPDVDIPSLTMLPLSLSLSLFLSPSLSLSMSLSYSAYHTRVLFVSLVCSPVHDFSLFNSLYHCIKTRVGPSKDSSTNTAYYTIDARYSRPLTSPLPASILVSHYVETSRFTATLHTHSKDIAAGKQTKMAVMKYNLRFVIHSRAHGRV